MMRQFGNEFAEYNRSNLNVRSTRLSPRFGNAFFFLTLLVLFALLQLASPSPIVAKEPHLEYVQGLRDRQYFDTAMIYLQSIEGRKNLPRDVKEVIAYQKGITLLKGSQFLQSPEAQAKQLGRAQAYLEQFVKASPRHELVASANTEMARIMLGKAQVLVWKSQSPAHEENRLSLQKDARKQIAMAKGIFQKSHDSYKKQWASFGVFIPEDEQEKRAARKRVEGLYMRSQLDLASCTYEEAQSYDAGSKEFVAKLRTASLEFEEVHTKYRSQYAGLYARTMQGKCFEEQDDIREALGIYSELLEHPGKSSGLKKLQNQVLQFRLICLNHESKKDYQLVVQEASEWLKFNKRISRSQIGLGIRWEAAKALEALAADRTISETDKTRLLRQALDHARQINKYAGPYKDVSHSMVQRLLVAMDREPGDPKTFDIAFGTAKSLMEKTGGLRDQLKKATISKDKKKIQAAEEELQAQLAEVERIFRLALELADDTAPVKQVNVARYRLAYTFYQQRKSYDAAVVARYLAVRKKEEDPKIALDAAYLSMAGFNQAYNDAPEKHKKQNLQLVVDISKFIATSWPNSDRATDARLEMGRLLRQSKKPLEAAKWYAEVPATASKYPSAQLEAGQSYWAAYLGQAFKKESSVPAKQLEQWQASAAKHLEVGIAKREQTASVKEPTPGELVKAKVSLSQIEIRRGNDAKAIQWLTKEPHSVTKAVQVAAGKSRPKESYKVQSTKFASQVYQNLLRAYIGTRQLDKAEQARAMLEKIAGSSGGAALTAVYVELGRELQNELERLQKLGDKERLEKVRGGFEQFLSKLYERKSGQTYGSLIWIAETYFGMAQGSGKEAAKSKQYYTDATKTFETILKRGESDPKFVDRARLDGVRLRLVNCKRQERDFPKAESLIKSVLKKNAQALDAQIEAARVYQNWGEFGGQPERFLNAIRGKKFEDGTVIWGWGNIARRLQRAINSRQAKESHKENYREAQYYLAQSRYLYAKKVTKPKQADEQLRRAKVELTTFTNLTPGLPKTEWWGKFDTLYQKIQTELGEAAVPLTKPEAITVVAKNGKKSNYDNGNETEEATAEVPAANSGKAKKKEPESGLMTYIFMGVVLLAGLGFVGFVVASPKSKKGTRSTAELVMASSSGDSESSFDLGSLETKKTAPRRQRTRPVSGEQKRTEKRPQRTKQPGQKPPEKKTSKESQRSPRPKTQKEKPAEGTPKKRVRKKPPQEE